jgi:hypothetical protein
MNSRFDLGDPHDHPHDATTERNGLLFDTLMLRDTLNTLTLFIQDHFGDRDAGR